MSVPAPDAVSVDSASGDSPRERRLDARRNLEAIIEAARRTFAADPTASMQQVAGAAGLHRATVHRHFASRDDLLNALRRRAYEESLAALRDAHLGEDAAPDALERGTRSLVQQGERWQLHRYAAALQQTPATQEMGRLIGEVLARGQREGTVRDDVDADLLTVMWAGMLTMNDVLRERGMSNAEVAESIVVALLGPGARS